MTHNFRIYDESESNALVFVNHNVGMRFSVFGVAPGSTGPERGRRTAAPQF
jgi:hypothetical protein